MINILGQILATPIVVSLGGEAKSFGLDGELV